MPFFQLFPLVFAGVILGTFFPVQPPAGSGRRPGLFNNAGDNIPPGVVDDTNSPIGLSGLLVRFILNVYDTITDRSTTSSGDFPQGSANTADARSRFLSAIRMHGWTGVIGAASGGVSLLGPIRDFHGGIMTVQDELTYTRDFVSYVLVYVLSSHNDAVLSPGVVHDLARTFSMAGSLPLVSPTFHLDHEDIDFIFRTMVAIAYLVFELIPRVENEQGVRIAFTQFLEDPASLTRYTQRYGPFLSVEEIVRQTHRGLHTRGSSFRNLTVSTLGPHRGEAGPLVGTISNSSMFGHGRTNVEIEAGMGNVTLRDYEIEYLAALVVAALMQSYPPTTSYPISRMN